MLDDDDEETKGGRRVRKSERKHTSHGKREGEMEWFRKEGTGGRGKWKGRGGERILEKMWENMQPPLKREKNKWCWLQGNTKGRKI